MKKTLCIFFSVLLVSLVIFIPVSASSGSSFDPVYLNENPSYMAFSPVSNSPDLVISYSEAVDYEVSEDSEFYLPIFPFCLDSSYSPIDCGMFTVSAYNNGVLHESGIISILDYGNIPEELYSDGRREYDLHFSFSNPNIAYVALIPLSYYNDQVQASEIYNIRLSYLTSITGYSLGLADGIEQGKTEQYNDDLLLFPEFEQRGYSRGKQEGFEEGKQYGIEISDSDHQLQSITDAVLQVVSSPFQAISNALDFGDLNVFGVNLARVFFTIISLLIVGFIITKFI